MHTIFGPKHLLLLGISLAAVTACIVLTRKRSLAQVCKGMLYIGIVSELIKVLYYTVANEATLDGILPKSDLPFHLCSIQILFLLFLNFSKNEKLKRVLYSFMLPSCLFGGIAAILLATTSSLNGMWILSVQYFGYHAALVVFSAKLMTAPEFRPAIGDYFNCLKFLLVLLFVSMYINSILYDGNSNINFMYVASPPMSGLPYLNENKGWLVYILRYALLVLVCVTGCYGKVIWNTVRSKRSKSA